jgi:NADPH:quinone reductase-like Zn-dependent oxidoreductase
MQVAVLTRKGKAAQAFEIQTRPDLEPKANELLIKVEAFGLNFADVVARLGKYPDAPPMPSVLGYEVVGRIEKIGANVSNLEFGALGQRVLAFTRFGGYATQVLVTADACVSIPEDMDAGVATALCVQYCTAYYAAAYVTNLHPGEHVLVQSAAGGVGTALVQIAKNKGCVVYGTAGSDKKLEYLRELGVDVPINYEKDDFAEIISQKAPNKRLDAVFDAVGGKSVKKGFKLLRAGGRLVCYGASGMSQKGLFGTLKTAWEFGLYSPISLMMSSKSLLGVNMLHVADASPQVLKQCLLAVVELAQQGIAQPTVDGVYPIAQLAEAHEKLEFRKTIGKVAIRW